MLKTNGLLAEDIINLPLCFLITAWILQQLNEEE